MNLLKNISTDFLSLFFPRLCNLCDTQLPSEKEYICISCEHGLPETDQHTLLENDFTERFWGRVDIQFGGSLYYFGMGGKTQKLIHGLKYKGKQKIGIESGKKYGLKLKSSPIFPKMDLIIPVPLHPMKKHIRGYNQSELFAKGLSEALGIPSRNDILIRTEFTETQTRKTRISRIENVGKAFAVRQRERLKGKHVLLVDDVLTTGATLEACCLTLLEAEPDLKISLATIAMAGD